MRTAKNGLEAMRTTKNGPEAMRTTKNGLEAMRTTKNGLEAMRTTKNGLEAMRTTKNGVILNPKIFAIIDDTSVMNFGNKLQYDMFVRKKIVVNFAF